MAMATVYLTCDTCGADYKKTKKCINRADADRWQEYTRANNDGLCTTCHAAETKGKKQNDARDALQAQNLWVQLEGSDKQVAWAETLRHDILQAIYRSATRCAYMGAPITADRWDDIYPAIKSYVLATTQAKTYIDGRLDDAQVWFDRIARHATATDADADAATDADADAATCEQAPTKGQVAAAKRFSLTAAKKAPTGQENDYYAYTHRAGDGTEYQIINSTFQIFALRGRFGGLPQSTGAPRGLRAVIIRDHLPKMLDLGSSDGYAGLGADITRSELAGLVKTSPKAKGSIDYLLPGTKIYVDARLLLQALSILGPVRLYVHPESASRPVYMHSGHGYGLLLPIRHKETCQKPEGADEIPEKPDGQAEKWEKIEKGHYRWGNYAAKGDSRHGWRLYFRGQCMGYNSHPTLEDALKIAATLPGEKQEEIDAENARLAATWTEKRNAAGDVIHTCGIFTMARAGSDRYMLSWLETIDGETHSVPDSSLIYATQKAGPCAYALAKGAKRAQEIEKQISSGQSGPGASPAPVEETGPATEATEAPAAMGDERRAMQDEATGQAAAATTEDAPRQWEKAGKRTYTLGNLQARRIPGQPDREKWQLSRLDGGDVLGRFHTLGDVQAYAESIKKAA